MDQTSLFSYVAFAISIASAIIGVINHKQIKSKCCGASGTIGIDIGPTTPTDTRPAQLTGITVDVPR